MTINLLILGAGWTSTFLIPLCTERSVSYAATTRTGRDSTIQFAFDPLSDDIEPYRTLPDAQTVLIMFAIDKSGGAEKLVTLYQASRSESCSSHTTMFILLGTTNIWSGSQNSSFSPTNSEKNNWYDRHSPFTCTDRAKSEEEFLTLSSPNVLTTVLSLAGLWGGSRSMRNWVGKVAPTKEVLKQKGSLHMIHGLDVSRAILAVHTYPSRATGQRWLLSDGRIYDWWDLASAWGLPPSPLVSRREGVKELKSKESAAFVEDEGGPHARWVRELMREESFYALPRNVGFLGRALDSREFWETFDLSPVKARLEG